VHGVCAPQRRQRFDTKMGVRVNLKRDDDPKWSATLHLSSVIPTRHQLRVGCDVAIQMCMLEAALCVDDVLVIGWGGV
jgi:hypothetical protein